MNAVERIPFIDYQLSERFTNSKVFVAGQVVSSEGSQANIKTHTGVLTITGCGQLSVGSNVIVEGMVVNSGVVAVESISKFDKPFDFEQVDQALKLYHQDFRHLFIS
eukprot:TRINITY_DN6862_c0_g2_i2.p2 TRINITY_DN6862_c0_g2~~TRINITY_DN6862_c0_g2_i2.p2  ORF type:complete len:119 (+),score=7.03 TRINITY_DN6862_c0_g2_i2:38-358(+)